MRTNEGLAYDQNVVHDNAPVILFYAGLIANDFTEDAATTVASIGDSIIELTDYSESARPIFTVPASSNGSVISNSVEFTINANSTTAYGIFIASESAKGNAIDGFIYLVKKFSAPQLRDAGQTITFDLALTEVNA